MRPSFLSYLRNSWARGLVLAIVVLSGVPALKGVQARQPYAIKNADLQFEVPSGWQLDESDKNGNVVLMVERGALSVTFVVHKAPDDVARGMKEVLNGSTQNVVSDGPAVSDAHNGIPHSFETGKAELKGRPVKWRIDIFKEDPSVVVLMFGFATTYESHRSEYQELLSSMRKKN